MQRRVLYHSRWLAGAAAAALLAGCASAPTAPTAADVTRQNTITQQGLQNAPAGAPAPQATAYPSGGR